MRIFKAKRTSAPATEFGEGPIWHLDALWYCDIPARAVIRFDPAIGTATKRVFDTTVACLGAAQGGLIAGTEQGFAFISEEGRLRNLYSPLSQRKNHRMNDATIAPDGRFLAGSMSVPPNAETPDGAIWTPGRSKPLMEGFVTSNGLAFSPDGQILHVSDSHPEITRVWRCQYHPETGSIGNREVWIDFSGRAGRPDGAAIDTEGGYWIAEIDGGRVTRFAPDGMAVAVIEVPAAKPTKPAFGGLDGRTMFITTAKAENSDGGLYAVRLPIGGVPSTLAKFDHLG